MASRQLAYEAALQSFVLLKNNGNVLPLSASAKRTIAVVGPEANYSYGLVGDYYAGTKRRLRVMKRNLKPLCADQVCPGPNVTRDDFTYACVPTIADSIAAINNAAGGATLWAPGVDINSTDASRIPAALAAVSSADVVVLCVGLDNNIEHEGIDRPYMQLPGLQGAFGDQVVAAAAQRGTPVIVVLINGGAVSIDSLAQSATAIIEASYPSFGAPALAATLFGQSNRWGRLPYTIYPQAYQNQVSMNDMSMTDGPGRGYRYYTGTPLFSFGDGLSYSKFTLTCTGGLQPESQSIRIECHDTNSGGPAGDDVLLVYHRVSASIIHVINGSHPVPARVLVEFNRVSLAAGDGIDVFWEIPADRALGLTNEMGATVLYQGTHYLDVSHFGGPSATQTISIEWTGDTTIIRQPPLPF